MNNVTDACSKEVPPSVCQPSSRSPGYMSWVDTYASALSIVGEVFGEKRIPIPSQDVLWQILHAFRTRLVSSSSHGRQVTRSARTKAANRTDSINSRLKVHIRIEAAASGRSHVVHDADILDFQLLGIFLSPQAPSSARP